MKSLHRWLLPPRVVLCLLGILLLAACAWKAHALGTRSIMLAPRVWSTRWFQTCLVEGELFLGLWLLSGLYPRRAWLVAVACFFGFFQLNFILFLVGEKTCPCFANLRAHPGQTALLDLAAVLALLACKPFPAGVLPTATSHPQLFRALVVVFGLFAVPAAVLLGGRLDPSFLPDLREDRALKKRMDFQVNHPSNAELLALLQKNTGVSMSAEAKLAEEKTAFGKAQFQGVPAGSLMEQMLGKQSSRTFWLKTEEGYQLRRAPLWQRCLPWVAAAALLALVGAALVWLQQRSAEGQPEAPGG